MKDLLSIDKEFQEFKKEYLVGNGKAVEKFLGESKQNADVVSTDYLSQLLRTKIGELKTGKKSVLILDDFDRIDPEHIFRILNVLSAHMEGDEDNQFGFDYIIIVGDIRNIRSIFHHKYGEQAEFDGYFDKFFTVKPYSFNNGKAVAERIPYLLQCVKYEDPGLKDALSESGVIKHLLEEVLVRAFKIGGMNLRQLYKPINHLFPEMRKGVFYADRFSDKRNQCIDIGIKLLIAAHEDKEHFLEILKRIRDDSSASDTKASWFYSEYSNSMLRRMLSLKDEEETLWLGKYSVVGSQDEGRSNQVNTYLKDKNETHARFFYDTFVEYVTRSKYDKHGTYEYEFQ